MSVFSCFLRRKTGSAVRRRRSGHFMGWPHAAGMNGESRKLPSVSATGMPTSWNALGSERTPMVECLTLEDALSLIEDLTVGHSGTSACLTRRCTGLRPLWGRDTYTIINWGRDTYTIINKGRGAINSRFPHTAGIPRRRRALAWPLRARTRSGRRRSRIVLRRRRSRRRPVRARPPR